MPGTTTDNRFSESKFIVDPSAANGAYTTISSALTDAVSGTTIFIRPGTYTENLALKDGVNLTAFTRDVNTVTIVGTITMNVAGTVNISGVTVQTNAATAVSFTSANLQSLTFTNCTLTSTNFDLITNSNSNVSSILTFNNCTLSAALTYKNFACSHAGTLQVISGNVGGATVTASTSTSSGTILYRQVQSNHPISLSGTAVFTMLGSNIGTANLTFLTLATGTNAFCYNSRISSGSAITFNVTSTGNCYALNCTVESSAATINTGTGNYFNSCNAYTNTVEVTSTSSKFTSTEFSKINVQTFTGSGTYTPTAGMKYCICEAIGGGGGGGGAAQTAAATINGGGGGGGGGYAMIVLTAAQIGASQTVTIGAAGTAGAAGNNAGGAGGNTSLGTLCVAGGGGAGGGAPSNTGGTPGTSGTGTTGTVLIPGGVGATGPKNSNATVYITVSGGSSPKGYGQGALMNIGGVGYVGTGYGAGGGGGSDYNSGANRAGGAGTAGYILITEYF